MLSYQHLYHAGNLADVHKHALLAAALDYMTRKPKPLSYIETHAGRGLYDLTSPEARRTGEAEAGIGRVAGGFPPEHPYARALAAVRAAHGGAAYPGSPAIAAELLRPGDRMHLAELHPAEFAALCANLPQKWIDKRQADGLEMALALTPPEPRRGLMLIDPSFEIRADYTRLPRVIGQVARKWNVGVLMLWYPILISGAGAGAHEAMRDALAADHPEALIHEVRFPPARPGHGMAGSGMVVLNPPWGLAEEAARLSKLFARL
ncbi:23S rRNA (adenine(2030)-N(6))-methyltransferase RlmJ [Phaeovulum vinaykumarii]|uniref:Ribosomal RNA large subunit methyltransferase J n=1 Tax=Phaeovulum vinaykumarii TaxID=407234 RepID=A0A1N7MHX7_9RHOB|nr:23S rRNA (adenine(2030)-N(6))-methyltransferase RlmJ [Phaeovulum vinaykumarii]SIS85519.1 23S rRNA (adenine2030-N6)-methyltransferase [Phaeovulum vinaykumarii]SOC12264.1 23S rRNA (adenine2030-N6)-methyltransferase [Phaeovulum vinaykumarii]